MAVGLVNKDSEGPAVPLLFMEGYCASHKNAFPLIVAKALAKCEPSYNLFTIPSA